MIIDVLGTPSEEEINNVPREKSRSLLRSLQKKKPKNLETIFKNASPLGKTRFLIFKVLSFGSIEKIANF